MKVLDLFAGIGGFSLGLERAGFETVAFCEIDPYCQKVLKKHWPDIPIYEDIRTFDGIKADVITAGFPCQNISSVSTKRTGLEGEQSGLWSEARRVIRSVRPQYIILENSPSLCVRGIGTILSDLAHIGYDAEWHGISAASVGAEHYRARQWVLAYPACDGHRTQKEPILTRGIAAEFRPEWTTESGVCRVANGVPAQTHRLRCLGNAIVPQIAEMIGRAINDNSTGH